MRTRDSTVWHWNVSPRARFIFAVTRTFVKPAFTYWPTSDRGIRQLEKLDALADRLPKPKNLDIEPLTMGGVPCEGDAPVPRYRRARGSHHSLLPRRWIHLLRTCHSPSTVWPAVRQGRCPGDLRSVPAIARRIDRHVRGRCDGRVHGTSRPRKTRTRLWLPVIRQAAIWQ